jgi:hypothetical protein
MSDLNGNGTESGRNALGRFLPGKCMKGAGRKKGSRTKLSESFLQDLHRTWLKHGPTALELVAKESPEVFVKTVASVLPRLLEIDGIIGVNHTHTVFAAELADFRTAYRRYGELIGATPKAIEHVADAEVPIESDDNDRSE